MNKTRRTDSLHICKLSYTTRFLYSTFYARVLELTALLIGGGARAAWLKERSACFWFRAFRSGLSAAVRFLLRAAISMIFRARSLCFGWHQSHYCLLWDSCQNNPRVCVHTIRICREGLMRARKDYVLLVLVWIVIHKPYTLSNTLML